MRRKLLINALLLVSLVLTCVTPGFSATINEKITITPLKTLSPRMHERLSYAAAKVLRLIASARGAIHKEDYDTASKDLIQAKALLKMIESNLPTEKIKDHIWVAKEHLDYESTEKVKDDLVPIAYDLTELKSIIPIQQAQKYLKEANNGLTKGDKKAARKALNELEKSVVIMEVDVPITSTRKHILAAESYLLQGEPGFADQELQKAENNVVLLGAVGEIKRSLWRATMDYTAGKFKAAKRELDKAGREVERALKSSDKDTRDAARKLKGDIQRLADKLKDKM